MSNNDQNQVERLACSIPEAGKMIGLGRTASYDAAKRGEIPTVPVGGRLVVPIATFRKKFGAGEPEEPGSL